MNDNSSLTESEKFLAEKLFKRIKKKKIADYELEIKEEKLKITNEDKKEEKIFTLFDNFNFKEKFIFDYLQVKRSRQTCIGNIYTKLLDFYSVISFIYFNPRTTLKKIKKVFKYNELFSDLILYMAKLNIIQMNIKQIQINKQKNNAKDYDIELRLDENINNFIEII